MPIELMGLLRRDHRDLDAGLAALARPFLPRAELCTTLDGVRLGLLAHGEAEDIVVSIALRAIPQASSRHALAHAHTEHRLQERALSALVVSQPGTTVWRQRIEQFRALVAEHADREERELVPAMRHDLSSQVFATLAGAFATERMRQLAMLPPSAPIASYPALSAM